MRMAWIWILLVATLPASLLAAGRVTGTIVDAASGDPLVNAQVEVVGDRMGAAADLDGRYLIVGAPQGRVTLKASFLGYSPSVKSVDLADGGEATVNFTLEASALNASEITIVASVAKERETPVAFTNVRKAEIVRTLGTRDVPMVLETTPGVYASESGGGAGDSRINVRGFNQRNVAVMINGVPVNDMENGWVYWSNWDGLGDVTSSMQVQRGLSAMNLAVPSVGGTMNILTDAAAMEQSLRVKAEVGNDGFSKQTIVGSTGLLDGRFAATGMLVRKQGDGLVEGAWSDAWSWFLGLSYRLNGDHRFDFYGVGSPQRHGQNLYTRSIASIDAGYARSEGIAVLPGEERGLEFNETWGYVGTQTQEFFNGAVHDPISSNKLYTRENYFHKPQFSLNWYWDVSDEMTLSTIAYHSYGLGGGTGTKGTVLTASDGHVDFDGTIANNKSAARWDAVRGGYSAAGILRNSVNNHKWWGLISKLQWKPTEDVTVMAGLDWRTFVGEHWREVRNLLGADFYVRGDNANAGQQALGLGGKYDYHFDNTVDWIGGFLQGEVAFGDRMTAYGTFATSAVTYEHKNYFLLGAPSMKVDDLDPALTLKGGVNYLVDDEISVYANAGWLSKAPIFDNVIDDGSFTAYEDPKNETILAMEGGMGYSSLDRTFSTNLNGYYTQWNDRSWSTTYTSAAGTDYLFNIPGVDAVHMGVELDALVRPTSRFQFKTAVSVGNWEWKGDATSVFRPDDNPNESYEVAVSLDGLKVSDAPQTQFSVSPTWFPAPGAYLGFDLKYAANYYADFDPTGRSYDPTDPADTPDTAQSWKVPSYTLIDFHAGYTLKFDTADVEFFGHVFNLTDEAYITEADDGSGHDAASARVFFGLPRTWTLGMAINL